MSFFSAFSYTSPVMPIIDKKSQFCHNHGLLWTKKTKRCLFSLFLMKKSLLFSPYFFKNGPFSKKTHSSHAHILSKKSPFSQNTVLSCHFFFKIFVNCPLLSYRRLVKKTKILSKLYFIIN